MKVISNGAKTYQVECEACHSIIEYSEFEVKHRCNSFEEWESFGVLTTWDEIICPVCHKKIIMNKSFS